MVNPNKASSAVFNINYHIAWCTKYRRKALNPDIRASLENILRTICDARGWEILEVQAMEDHIHLFLSTSPFESPMNIVKVLKGVSAKQLFRQHPEIRNVLKKGHLWSPSYYVGTAGHVSAEAIERYIQEQCSRGEVERNPPII